MPGGLTWGKNRLGNYFNSVKYILINKSEYDAFKLN